MEEKMKLVNRGMALRMGIMMSFVLSFIGTFQSGHFTLFNFLFSFLISAFISLGVGFLVPMGKITGAITASMGLKRGSFFEKLVSSFISNLIYTPIMSLIMIYIAYKRIMFESGGMAQVNFWGMFLPSFAICFVFGFFLIYIVQPRFLKELMIKYDVPLGPVPPVEDEEQKDEQ